MKNSPSKPKHSNISKATTSNVVRNTRSTTHEEPTKSSAEGSFKLNAPRKAGYCLPTQSTLHRKAQVKAEKEESTLGLSGKGKSPGSGFISRKASNPLPQFKSVPATRPAQKLAQAPQKKPTTSTRLVRKVVPVVQAKTATSARPLKTNSASGIKPTTSTRLIRKDALPAFQKRPTDGAEALRKSSSLDSEKTLSQDSCAVRKRASLELQDDPTNSAILVDEEASDSRSAKKARLPSDAPSTSGSEDSQSDYESELSEPSPVKSRDLGPGFIQYFTPAELELYHAYHGANPEERQAMVDRGEVDAAEMERAYQLEHIFDHLPVPGKDFEPPTTETLPEMFLDPALRRIFLEETNRKLTLSYMDHQTFSFETRTRVVEMMALKLHASCWRRDTFLLAVNLLDSVLAKGSVRGTELIIYSMVCILIATKLNERIPMSVDELASTMAEDVPLPKMEKAELNVLNFLNFDVYCIPSHQFLIRIGFYDKFNKHIITQAKYFLEISLYEITLVTELPSKLAAACYALARRILVGPEWTAGHHYYSGYTLDELEPIIEIILDVIERIPIDSNISIRYNCTRHQFASHTAFSIFCRDYDVVKGFKK
ncbi:B-type cyclin [Entomophthora muscae]|uniref:B-type cyclin n=1 Tax=Entomophthora muscae TaxID=34485 RepID=A0ACC2T549_9FUNG|nr:B-type cyclin [Entomophthora muscae]